MTNRSVHHIPDTDNPIRFIQTYVDAVCPGSYVAVAHPSDGGTLLSCLAIFHYFYQIPIPPLTFRNLVQIDVSSGDLLSSNLVLLPIPLWQPEQDEDLEHFPGRCGLGRKPCQP
jgi:hypothetical protein